MGMNDASSMNARVNQWLAAQLRKNQSSAAHDDISASRRHAITIEEIDHGQSNPTYLVTVNGSNNNNNYRRYVLRKKPNGKLLKGAHDVQREFNIMKAIHNDNSGFPVPHVIAFEEDSRLLGTQFYMMDFVDGHIFRSSKVEQPTFMKHVPANDATMKDLRRKVYLELSKTLAQLHNIDADSLTIGNNNKEFARFRKRYCLRVLNRWSRNYQASIKVANKQSLHSMRNLETLLRLLERDHIAKRDDTEKNVIVHGDYRIDNVIFDWETTTTRACNSSTSTSSCAANDVTSSLQTTSDDRYNSDRLYVKAVLDWELSTLGDGLCDLATLCLQYHIPSRSRKNSTSLAGTVLDGLFEDEDGRGQHSSSLDDLGIPMEQEVIDTYCNARDIPAPSAITWAFYVGLSMFKMASILDGVGTRNMMGNQASSKAGDIGAIGVVDELAKRAITVIRKSLDSDVPRNELNVLQLRVSTFVENDILPNVRILDEFYGKQGLNFESWEVHPLTEKLKEKAKLLGLWNLWISKELRRLILQRAKTINAMQKSSASGHTPISIDVLQQRLGKGLSNEEFAIIGEAQGRALSYAGESLNCSAPDTGNMEILARFGSDEHFVDYLLPLLEGRIRSCFLMTEPHVASSDATQIESTLKPQSFDNDSSQSSSDMRSGLVLNGRKWWATGSIDPRCKVCLCLAKDLRCDEKILHKRHSIVIVDIDAVRRVRALDVFGFHDCPSGHAEIALNNIQIDGDRDMVGPQGSGFHVAQARLGPGRLHHCIRLIGGAEFIMELASKRAQSRVMFGKKLAEHGHTLQKLGKCRIAIEQARLLTRNAAKAVDAVGSKEARKPLAVMKAAVPSLILFVSDSIIQLFGAAGLCSDFPCAQLAAAARTLRIADGPDEVHIQSIGKMELTTYKNAPKF